MQLKTLFSTVLTADITADSQVAVLKVERQREGDREQIFFAISTGLGFKTWQLGLDQRGETVQSGPTSVLEVEEAHNGEVVTLMQFIEMGGESYLTTGAGLD